LWSATLGADVPRYASAVAADAAVTDRVALLRRLEAEEASWGVAWDRDLFGRTIAHDPGAMDLGGGSPELIALPGHAPGQLGVWLPASAVLFAGDTASDIDPPALPTDRAGADTYLSTLGRMLDLVADARVVVPGHGSPCDGEAAERRLTRDRRYVDAVFDVVDQGRSRDVAAAIATIAAAVEDSRLDTPGGRQLHLQNLTDLLET
jgi:glyoxylase-like metal-dependent hydrolase (beta-lactamase superfamily II)